MQAGDMAGEMLEAVPQERVMLGPWYMLFNVRSKTAKFWHSQGANGFRYLVKRW